MITCVSIDDEPLALKQINGYIEKIPYLQLLEGFTSAIKALDFLQHNEVDLMFVDINMPDLSGMDFVKSLSNPPKVIFTTAYREYAAEGFQVDAADYLVKPISFTAFAKAVDKTRNRYFQNSKPQESIQNNDQFLFIKSEYKIIRINLDDIKYIEGMRDYVRIHLDNEKPIMALLGMKNIQQHLPSDKFMRVHRSYIVNLNKIHIIERNRIVFNPDVYIPVSDQYKEEFQKYLDHNFLK
ncbi:LytR/AlgR family response regulator transcription factor [Thermophagus xiamenensis]|uniref:Two component transcriptional regulator, LytTR family n=1 Tax=Thermophagus xiamenensis TaxID=385682 RepID=A0A1I2DUG1_9BACT|nr:LytTR family DNA-binding domain-containing protein [Thermophagus xiamenensis]SFE84019.1 two component transcriptional regulator, LytTR family [Thermophagus xiamenensis]